MAAWFITDILCSRGRIPPLLQRVSTDARVHFAEASSRLRGWMSPVYDWIMVDACWSIMVDNGSQEYLNFLTASRAAMMGSRQYLLLADACTCYLLSLIPMYMPGSGNLHFPRLDSVTSFAEAVVKPRSTACWGSFQHSLHYYGVQQDLAKVTGILHGYRCTQLPERPHILQPWSDSHRAPTYPPFL